MSTSIGGVFISNIYQIADGVITGDKIFQGNTKIFYNGDLRFPGTLEDDSAPTGWSMTASGSGDLYPKEPYGTGQYIDSGNGTGSHMVIFQNIRSTYLTGGLFDSQITRVIIQVNSFESLSSTVYAKISILNDNDEEISSYQFESNSSGRTVILQNPDGQLLKTIKIEVFGTLVEELLAGGSLLISNIQYGITPFFQSSIEQPNPHIPV